MRQKLTSILGYTAAALSVLAAVLTPFLLINLFARGVAGTGVRIDPVYTGGDVLRTIPRGAYRIVVHQPVKSRAPLPLTGEYVQIDWTPAAALPAQVSDEVDLDGDGRAELRAVFDVPPQAGAPLKADVEPLGERVQPLKGVGKDRFDRLFIRVKDSLVLRVPLRNP